MSNRYGKVGELTKHDTSATGRCCTPSGTVTVGLSMAPPAGDGTFTTVDIVYVVWKYQVTFLFYIYLERLTLWPSCRARDPNHHGERYTALKMNRTKAGELW